MKCIRCISLYILPILVTSCVYRKEPFTSGTYILRPAETVQISQLQLSITNKGCGRAWVGNEEQPFCELSIRHRDSTIRAGHGQRPIYIGTIKIEVEKMNPRGVVEDSIPPGGCRISVTKLDDISR